MIEKFAQNHTANSGEFLDHHTSFPRHSSISGAEPIASSGHDAPWELVR
jgi:hypothetical protein